MQKLATPLKVFFENVYRTHKIPGASASTLRQYRSSLANFRRYLNREAVISDLQDHVVAAVAHDMISRGRAAHSARKFQDNICSIWRFAAQKKFASEWPAVAMIVPPTRAPIAWTEEQLKRLFEACEKETGMIGSVPAPIWWHSLHSVIWDSAERITAVLSTKRNDMDLESRWLIIRAEHRKGKRADNPVRLHPDTCLSVRSLIEHLHKNEPRILPWPFDMGTLYNWYKRILTGAGLPADRYHKFHCIRRSSASYFEAAGHDATKLLGHSSRKVTERYLDPRIVTSVQASDVLFRPAG